MDISEGKTSSPMYSPTARTCIPAYSSGVVSATRSPAPALPAALEKRPRTTPSGISAHVVVQRTKCNNHRLRKVARSEPLRINASIARSNAGLHAAVGFAAIASRQHTTVDVNQMSATRCLGTTPIEAGRCCAPQQRHATAAKRNRPAIASAR